MGFYDDIPNVANCSDVAQLYECALLLINNSKLLRDWVNGSATTDVILGGQAQPSLRKLIQNINMVAGIASSTNLGAVRPDNVTTQVDAFGILSVIIGGLIENGGGLVTSSNGKLAVDFSQMPTDKFEALMKSLRLPLWLTSDSSFYVNKSHANASNTLDEGRGLSASKPFKSIQACVNYITENYNINSRTATIYVSNETYQEKLVLPAYSRTTGKINIYPINYTENYSYVNLAGAFSSYNHATINCTGGAWHILYPKIMDNYDYSNASETDPFFLYQGFLCSGGDLYLYSPNISVSLTGAIQKQLLVFLFRVTNGRLRLVPTGRYSCQADLTATGLSSPDFHKYMFQSSGNNSELLFDNNTTLQTWKHFYLGGAFDIVAATANKGSIRLASVTNYLKPAIKSELPITGKRYECNSGGSINVTGLGAEFFPGNVAGSVDADSYSWYK